MCSVNIQKGECLKNILARLNLEPIERSFGRFINGLAGEKSDGLLLAAVVVSRSTGEGDVCVNLHDLAGRQSRLALPGEELRYPRIDRWIKDLRRSGVVGDEGDYAPLVLDDDGRLYLHRYWQYQEDVARFIRGASENVGGVDFQLVKNGIGRLFSEQSASDDDWQKIAAFAAVRRKFCVITGGPGTGKTTTVAKILALLLEQSGEEKLEIALAAPTGKAVARLQESIVTVCGKLNCAVDVKDKIPRKAQTLHRLLGVRGNSGVLRYNRQNPLPCKVLVVDEASMVDLPMMANLVRALRPECRLVLIGDREQLASVEPGSVLGDLCRRQYLDVFSGEFRRDLQEYAGVRLAIGRENKPGTFHDSIVELKNSFRFTPASGIGRVSAALKNADLDEIEEHFLQNHYQDAHWRQAPSPEEFEALIVRRAECFADELIGADSPEEALGVLDRFRFLCPGRYGGRGVENINRIVKNSLVTRGVVPVGRRYYRGKPIMVVQNDYERRLFNGDNGIVWPDENSAADLRVFFRKEDGIHSLSTALLPPHETVYAMTVHKSQGSEFDEVCIVLPEEPLPVLTRELIYTAFTRARKKVELLGERQVFIDCISRVIKRESGLSVRIWPGIAGENIAL